MAAAPEIDLDFAQRMTLAEATDSFRRELIARRLHDHRGNLAATARSLGLDRGNFHRLIKRLGVRRD